MTLKIIRKTEWSAFQRVGWAWLAAFDDVFDLVKWPHDSEPVLPRVPFVRPLRRNRARASA